MYRKQIQKQHLFVMLNLFQHLVRILKQVQDDLLDKKMLFLESNRTADTRLCRLASLARRH